MQNNDKISPSQLGNIIILTIVGIGILTLPRNLAEAVETNGWLVLLIGGLITALFVYGNGYIVKKIPETSIKGIVTATLSKPVANVYMVFLLIYLIILNGFLTRIFAEVIKMFMLYKTPIEVIILSVLLVTVFLVRKGIEVLGRLAQLLLPIIMVPTLILFLLLFQGSHLTNLLPILDITFMEVVKAIPLVLFSFLGFDLILVFGAYTVRPDRIPRMAGGSILLILLFYICLNTGTLLVFGSEQTKHLIWPTLSLFKTIELPGLFIENVEILVMSMWVFTVFMSIAPLYMGKIVILEQLLNSKRSNYLALPLIPLVYFFSLLGDNLGEAYAILDIFTKYVSTIVAFGVPLLIFISIRIRERFKKEGKHDSQ